MFVKGFTAISATDFVVWKTLTLGLHKSLSDLEKALTAKDVIISSGGSVITHAPEFVLSAEQKEIDVMTASLEDLGFDEEYVDHWDVLKRAHEIGLRLCPAEVGPTLCLACEKEELREHGVVIGMPLMGVPECNPQAFFVASFEDPYNVGDDDKEAVVLSGAHDGPDLRWNRGTRGVFVKLRR